MGAPSLHVVAPRALSVPTGRRTTTSAMAVVTIAAASFRHPYLHRRAADKLGGWVTPFEGDVVTHGNQHMHGVTGGLRAVKPGAGPAGSNASLLIRRCVWAGGGASRCWYRSVPPLSGRTGGAQTPPSLASHVIRCNSLAVTPPPRLSCHAASRRG
jgi:hypothetical protein